jgi:peroxiredoxin
MLRLLSRLLVVLVGALIVSIGASVQASSEVIVDKLNKKIDNITLHDAAGKARSLYDLKGKKAIVVVFLSFECPVSTSYSSVLAELAKTYRDKQVAFVAVDSSDDGDAVHLAKQAAEFKLPFPVFKDENFRAADAFKADTVPSAFVLDHNFVLRYRGRIDDGYYARLKKNGRITRHDLRQALDEVLAGKAVSEPATKPIGCAIVRERKTRKKGTITFYRDVLPIIQKNCQECHRPGAVGPFALMTYKQAVNWADDIKEYTQQRKMPPWKPVEGPGFRGERKLSDKEIETLAAWVDGGMAEGDAKEAPPPRQFVEGWQLGQPDLVLTVPEEMTVGATGPDLFRCFVLPTNLSEDKFVTAVEVRPGNSRIVHHTLNYFDISGKGRELEKKEREKKSDNQDDRGPGYSSAMGLGFLPAPGQVGPLGGWAPGNVPHRLPDGYGYFLPKGADIIIQVHYHRNGRVEKDRTTIGLHFAKGDQTKRWKNIVLPGRFLFIPPGNDHYRVHGELEVLQECKLYSVMPHMHMLGREIKVTLTPPDGPPMTLVAIKDWEYNWQETYFFKEPIPLKPGTRLAVEAIYDNSDKNPNNPFSPPRLVKFGEQTTDEMCYVFFGATSETPGGIKVRRNGKRTEEPPRSRAEQGRAGTKSFQVPYRLTEAKHILVRAKINGKGPYHFLVDTGAPALFVAASVARQLGIKPDPNDWGILGRFEIEGGVVLTKIKGRIETPPQIEGMNALGLAGVELHGMIGYDILSRYRLEIDFTSDKMVWTPLNYKPKVSLSLARGGGISVLDLLSGLMKSVSPRQANPPVRLRGFLGVELRDQEDAPVVQTVLAEGPAGKAGVKVGDRITHVQGRSVLDSDDVQRCLSRKKPGEEITLTVQRGEEAKEITVKLGEGL